MSTYHRFYEQSVLSLLIGADGDYDDDLDAHVSVAVYGDRAEVELTTTEPDESRRVTERFRVTVERIDPALSRPTAEEQ